ncbi:MAG: alpha/beta hydrolase [Bacteroidetes bacterium]|nr:alpha/beta hydrolase [Bacteroidota bacterium]
MLLEIKQEGRFKYAETGTGEVLLLLHGLFGALSNFEHLINSFSDRFRIIIPILPLYDLKPEQTNVDGMLDYIDGFIRHKEIDKLHLIGNSLGGHIAQLYYLLRPEKIKTMTLTASSGLFENTLGDAYPRKGDYEFVQKKTQTTFYDPKHATKELVDEVFEIVNNREKVLRLIFMAKSALRNNLREQIPGMKVPVCLIWGEDDTITPPFVGKEFHTLLPNSELHIIKQCGHAPMMEKPEEFNRLLEQFLNKWL